LANLFAQVGKDAWETMTLVVSDMRILIRHKSTVRKFIVLESSDRDGSLALIMRREGVSTYRTSWTTRPDESEPRRTDFQEARSKSKRVTIHQSGRMNYHENGRTIFIEPLTRTTQVVPVYGYRVPSLEKLDLHAGAIAKEDVALDLSDLEDGPVSFSLFVGPKEFAPTGRAMNLNYDAEGYSVVISIDPVPFAVPRGLNDHFTTITPDRGPFLQQQMAEDQAMICYPGRSQGPLVQSCTNQTERASFG
jgi:hypothetical protein